MGEEGLASQRHGFRIRDEVISGSLGESTF
jgi:hypothetical protein